MILLTILLFVSPVVLLLLYKRILPRPIPGIPYNKSATQSPFGDLPNIIRRGLGGDTFQWFGNQCNILQSPIVQVWMRAFSRRPSITVSDFWETQNIVIHRAKEFDRAPGQAAAFDGMTRQFTFSLPTNERRRAHRRLFAKTMSPAFVNGVAGPLLYASAVELVKLWRLKSALAKGHPIAAEDDLKHTVFEAMCYALIGMKTDVHKVQIQFLSHLHQIQLHDDVDEVARVPSIAHPRKGAAMGGTNNKIVAPLNFKLWTSDHLATARILEARSGRERRMKLCPALYGKRSERSFAIGSSIGSENSILASPGKHTRHVQ